MILVNHKFVNKFSIYLKINIQDLLLYLDLSCQFIILLKNKNFFKKEQLILKKYRTLVIIFKISSKIVLSNFNDKTY
jgi:hypothetical protein